MLLSKKEFCLIVDSIRENKKIEKEFLSTMADFGFSLNANSSFDFSHGVIKTLLSILRCNCENADEELELINGIEKITNLDIDIMTEELYNRINTYKPEEIDFSLAYNRKCCFTVAVDGYANAFESNWNTYRNFMPFDIEVSNLIYQPAFKTLEKYVNSFFEEEIKRENILLYCQKETEVFHPIVEVNGKTIKRKNVSITCSAELYDILRNSKLWF
jgi:hypothetical protein